MRHMLTQGYHLDGTHNDDGDETDDEHQRADEAKDVHGFHAECADKPETHQIQVSIHETVQTHELALAVLTCLMMHRFLTNLAEACILGKVGDEAVHLAIHFDVLHHVLSVCLQSAVEVVQVVNAAHHTCCRIEELRGDGFRQRVTFSSVHLESTHKVVSIFLDHPVQFRDLVWAVLQVCIHRDDHITFCTLETMKQGRALAVIPSELDAMHLRKLLAQFLNHVP